MQGWKYLSLEVRWEQPTFGGGYWLTMLDGKQLKGWGEIWPAIGDLGRRGWELVTVLSIATGGSPHSGYRMEYYFKRPIPDSSPESDGSGS